MKDFLDKLKKFYINLNENDIIYLFFDESENYINLNKSNIKEYFKSKELKNKSFEVMYLINDKEDICITKENMIYLLQYNYRLNNVFGNSKSDSIKPLSKTSDLKSNEYNIEIGVKNDQGVTKICSFSGNKRDCIAFINDHIKTICIKSFGKDAPLLKLDLNSMEDDNWYSIEELKEKGLVKLS